MVNRVNKWMFVWINEFSFSFSLHIAWFHWFLYYKLWMSSWCLISLRSMYDRLEPTLLFFLEIQSSPQNFVTFLVGFCSHEYWLPSSCDYYSLSASSQPIHETQVLSQFSKSLTYNNCECGKFYLYSGWEGMDGRYGGFYIPAVWTASNGTYHHQGSLTGPFQWFS